MLFCLSPLYSLLYLRLCECNMEMAGPLEEGPTLCSTVAQAGLY